RDLPIGHIQMEFVAPPGFLPAMTVGLASHGTIPRQVGQHFLQRHLLLALDPRHLLRSLGLSPFAPRFGLRWFGSRRCRFWFHHPFTRCNRRSIPADVSDESIFLGL